LELRCRADATVGDARGALTGMGEAGMTNPNDDTATGPSRFVPGADPVPTHTVEFERIESDSEGGLVRYVPGDYVPRGAPADVEEPEPRSRDGARQGRRRPTPVHGLLGIACAIATVALLVTGINLALIGDFDTSRVIAFVAVGASILGFLLGGISVILRRGTALGVVAMVVCVVANPVLLAQVLGWVRTLAGI
jgi:hypothetical protein